MFASFGSLGSAAILVLTLLASACAGRPPAPGNAISGPTRASEEQVSFQSQGLTLVGSLILPERARAARVPAAVVITGSGPSPAYCTTPGQLGMGFGATIPICRDIADALREAGVATLLYDKRTCGPFNGCASNGYPPPPPDMVIDTELQDARAAIEMLRTRSELDPARVIVVGHSQGASFVPELLRTDALLRGGILLAAPFQGPSVILAEQARLFSLLVSKGPPSEAGEKAASDLLRAASDLSTMLASGAGTSQAVLGAPVVYWRSWSELVARVQEHVHLVKQPMLILGGDYDFNVSTTELELWREALRGNSGARIEKLSCVTHALNCIQQPNPFAVRSSDIGANVSEEVLASLTRFVREVTREKTGS